MHRSKTCVGQVQASDTGSRNCTKFNGLEYQTTYVQIRFRTVTRPSKIKNTERNKNFIVSLSVTINVK